MRTDVVEGSRGAVVQNMPDYTFYVLQNLNRGNAERLISFDAEESIARGVTPRTVTVVVIVSINLNQESMREAGEICDIGVNGILFAELQSIGSRPQNIPKQDFRQAHSAAKLPSQTDVFI
jgi:hypothetical protein